MSKQSKNKKQNKMCQIGNNCMRFRCSDLHHNKYKEDCIKGDLCYDVRCNDLHSRARNFKLFKKDYCYFGSDCNRRRLGECDRFHNDIDELPNSTYLLLKKIKEKERKQKEKLRKEKERNKKQKLQKEMKEKYRKENKIIKENPYSKIIENKEKHNSINSINKYELIDDLICLDLMYSNGNYTYLTEKF